MDLAFLLVALRLGLAFVLAALAAVLLLVGLAGPGAGGLGTRRLAAAAAVLLAAVAVAALAAFLPLGPWLAWPLLALGGALVLWTLKVWRLDPTGRVWRGLRTDPDALRRMGVDADGARLRARGLACLAVPLAGLLLAEFATVDVLLPLLALLLALLGQRLTFLLPAAGLLGFLALPLVFGGPWALAPYLAVALVALLPRPRQEVAGLG